MKLKRPLPNNSVTWEVIYEGVKTEPLGSGAVASSSRAGSTYGRHTVGDLLSEEDSGSLYLEQRAPDGEYPISKEELIWRRSLKIGDEVDAKDKYGLYRV